MVIRSLSAMAVVTAALSASAATITLDPDLRYQTINGWEATAYVAEPTDPAFPNFKDVLYDMVVDDVGITRLRLEVRSGVENTNANWADYQAGVIDYATWRARRYATVNDNADPDAINWAGFHFEEMDWAVENVVNPLRQRMAARGEHLYVNVNYVAFTNQITQGGSYMHNNAAEYAEFVLATCLHLRDKYGWTPDGWEVILEPDNVSQWNGTLIGQSIVAAGGKLAANGMDVEFIAPSNTNMTNAVSYFDQLKQTPGVMQYLKEFAYHRYGGVSQASLQAIAQRGRQYGLRTSMLEWWSDSNTHNTLHEDLKTGENAAWQQAVVSGFFDIDKSDALHPVVTLNAKTRYTRQYYRYVRPGAVRIGATSNSGTFDPLAFVNADGRHVVVIKASAGGSVDVDGLPGGVYGITLATAGLDGKEIADQRIRTGDPLATNMPAAGVMTIRQRCPAADTTGDCAVGAGDLSTLADQWIKPDCPEANLLGRWKLDEEEGATTADASGYGRDGIVRGEVLWRGGEGRVNGALEFNGIDSNVEIPSYAGATGSAPRSVSAWIKTSQLGGQIVSWGIGGAGARWVFRLEDGLLKVTVGGGSAAGSTLVADGVWHHVAAVSEGTNSAYIRLYVDGRADPVSSLAAHPVDTGSTVPVRIGVYAENPEFFRGLIDEVRIYGAALTSEEVRRLAARASTNLSCPDLNGDDRADMSDMAALAENWLESARPRD